jgi:hypothetical protein
MNNTKNKSKKFLLKSFNKFGDKFDFSKMDYTRSDKKIKIICKTHNILFEQLPSDHLRGRLGCSLCSKSPKYDTNLFIKKSLLIHGVKYDYGLVDYKGIKTKVIIGCPEHGDFEQSPGNHLSGQGCPKCGVINTSDKKKYTTDLFIKKSIIVHGDKYDYLKVEYIDSVNKVIIGCPKHGDFEQSPSKHLSGKGCNKCGVERTKKVLTLDIGDFIYKSNIVHSFKYDYSTTFYNGSHNKIIIICPEHGEFEQLPYDHLSGHGCVKCTSSVSSVEKYINDFIINELNIMTIQSSRSIIEPQQLDIYIPSHNLAIEYNGLYWHSEKFIYNNYHLDKTLGCENKGIRLIHIFEDEWLNKEYIVKSRLKNILGLTNDKIYARQCNIKYITKSDKDIFLNKTHLQGSVKSSVNLGLYYNDELVSVMTFNKPRLGIGAKFDGYELSRFANKLDTNVIGGASRLLKHFINAYNPNEIRSYADRRWSDGGLYNTLGFDEVKTNKPNYWYIVGKARKHRFNFRKSKLSDDGFDTENLTEHEIMLNRKIYRIYDCGTITYKKTL